jgi:hypothetical protein
MRHIHRSTGVQRKGMALLLVVFIAFASLVLLTTLMASVAPRRTTVSNELQADRALAVADGKIDLMMNTINTLPQVNVNGQADENDVQTAIVASWEGMLNGYAGDPMSSGNADGVSTHFYHTTTNTWYAVWDNADTPDHLMNIPATTKLGYQVGPTDSTTGTVLALMVKNLSTGGFEPSGIIAVDDACRTNNEWFEVDTNARYNIVPTDVWTMQASAYSLSRRDIVRTLEAKAEKSVNVDTTSQTTSTPVYNWFTSIDRSSSFSDYVFLDNFDVNFGKYSEVSGYIHANGTVNMGGWAKYPVTSTDHVTDYAVDGSSGNHDGRFSTAKKDLAWAKLTANKYAVDHAPAVPWLQVDVALIGASAVYKPFIETGIQDRAIDPYYISGNATITFSIESGAGKVTINGTKYDVPAASDLYIFVTGNATVKGDVLGSCVVGASGNVYLAGDILYNTPPRTDENGAMPQSTDFLGLVAGGNVVIPYSTFVADKNLIIDAAMVADGWLGTDSSEWPWHNLKTDSSAPTLVVRGSMAAGDGSHMMATTQVTSGGVRQIKGYDLRQYSFDWNLKQLGVPDGFPTTGTGTTSTETGVTAASLLHYGIVTSLTEGETLVNQLTNPSTHPSSSPLVIGGRAYYAKQTGTTSPVTTWSGTGFVTSGMYRIGWKEQIGDRVAP